MELTATAAISDAFSPETDWHSPASLALAWRDWGEDEVIVFSQKLGYSLLLSAPCARVLSVLEQAAPNRLSCVQIVEAILPDCEPDTQPADVHALLDAALPELYRLGLAEPTVENN